METARKHYPETSLFTDDAGARILIDGIGLQFDYVSTELNTLEDYDPGWWSLGKLYAYRAQREPFIHVDNDVFLWKPLPERLENAPVFAQNPEYFSVGAFWYKPEEFDYVIGSVGGRMPEEWKWYRSAGVPQRGECCGVIGGRRVDFIGYYAGLAIELVEDPLNGPGWARLADKIGNTITLEQYLLSACIEYHRRRAGSPFSEIDIQYLFNSMEEAYCPEKAGRAGFTHLLADAKRNAKIAERLEKRVMRDYPDYYRRCIETTQREGGARSSL